MDIEQGRANNLELGCSAIENQDIDITNRRDRIETVLKNKFCLIPNFAEYNIFVNVFLG